MRVCYIGMGSNVGDRLTYLVSACQKMQSIATIQTFSSVYESEPVGGVKQDDFFNAVIALETDLAPLALLSQLKKIEKHLQRKTTVRWGPRTIDLDILAMGDLVLQTDELTIPHPEIARRRFVLLPWQEIAPDFLVPILDVSVRQLLQRTQDHSKAALHIPAAVLKQKTDEV